MFRKTTQFELARSVRVTRRKTNPPGAPCPHCYFSFFVVTILRAYRIVQQHTVESLQNRCHLKPLNFLLFLNRSLFLSPVCLSPVSVTGQELKLTSACAAWGSFFSLLVKSRTCPSACQVLLLGSRSYFTLVRRIHWSHASSVCSPLCPLSCSFTLC